MKLITFTTALTAVALMFNCFIYSIPLNTYTTPSHPTDGMSEQQRELWWSAYDGLAEQIYNRKE